MKLEEMGKWSIENGNVAPSPPLLYNEVRNLCSNFPLTDAFDLLLFIQIYTVKHYV